MYVNGEKYSVDIGFPEGTHQMLPEETLEIPISVYLDRLDENGQFVSERIRDYFLSVESYPAVRPMKMAQRSCA